MPERGSHSGGGAAVQQPAAAQSHGALRVSPDERLATIVESSDDAILSKSPTGEIMSWNAAAERLYGYSPEEAIGKPISILIPPERSGEEMEILRRIMAGDHVDHYETERVRRDGQRVMVSLSVSPMHDPGGSIVGASVIARDITERRRGEERAARLQAVTAALTEALSPQEIVDLAVHEVLPALDADAATFALVSDDGDTLEVVGSEGYSAEAMKGWERFPVDAKLPLSDAVRTGRAVWTDSAESLVARYPALAHSEVRFASLAAVPLVVEGRSIGGMALSYDRVHAFTPEDQSFILAVAQQAAGALERGKLYEREHEARAEAERAGERLAFLSRASEIFAESLELDEILQRIADVAVPRIADWCAVDLSGDKGEIRRVAMAHADPARIEFAREVGRRYPPDPRASRGVPAVIRSGEPELYPEISDEMVAASARDEEHLRLVRALALKSAMIVPLTARGRTLGAVTFITSGSGHAFTDADLAFAEDLARRAALAVDNSLLYGEEHQAAVTLQRSLLPDALPEMAGVELAARYLPAGRGIEVGGDWYDALQVGERLVVAVGDVAGRGIGAASVMGQLRNALRAYAADGQVPARALERLNRLAAASEGAEMATLMYLVLDPSDGSVEYVRAGHPPALVRRPDGTVHRLEDPGSPPLGVSSRAVYRAGSRALAPGSLILLYTDGLVERRDAPLKAQLDRLERALRDAPVDLESCCDFVLRAMGVDGDAGDDTALLALGVSPTRSDRFRLQASAEVTMLAQIRRELGRWLSAASLGRRDAHAVVTATVEACTNAAEHAYAGGDAGALEVEASLEGGRVTVSVRDFGNWREPPAERSGLHAERGRGFTLMNGLMDQVDVDGSVGGTEVVMTRHFLEGAAA